VNPNPVLRQLGYGTTDRVVIVHADDLGMCQATLPAFADLLDFGLVASGAAMVPCAWFPAVADWCHQHPAADVGVHLTLTSEWQTYRWGPLSTRDPASGLLDLAGYFHSSVAALREQAETDAVAVEMRLQLARARQAGLEPTHLDCHMYAGLEPPFLAPYLGLSAAQRLPAMVVRHGPYVGQGRDALLASRETQGLPIFDRLVVMGRHGPPAERVAQAKQLFTQMAPGLTCLLLHPAQDTPELRAIVPDWRYRVADYEAFLSVELRQYVRNAGLQVMGYRTLQTFLQRGR
jgi:predicted glycoside hydrolase/deacetylase ChbG (UPF0249 family)